MSIIGIICLLLALCTGIWAAYRDVTTMLIPNRCSVFIAILWLVAAVTSYEVAIPLVGHLITGGILFAVAVLFYGLRIWGGGDAKLLAGFGFWFSLHQAVGFIFWMTVIGGVLAVITLILRKRIDTMGFVKNLNEKHWLQQLKQGKAAIPYGIAITGSAILNMMLAAF